MATDRNFFKFLIPLLVFCGLLPGSHPEEFDGPHILLITVDDMNCDSVGAFGCPIENITPHIDQLAKEGMMFEHAYVNIAVCQPVRSLMMTGRYPHNNGAMGFDPIYDHMVTLQDHLKGLRYFQGILSKVKHLKPQEKFHWDYVVTEKELNHGRNSKLYYQHAREFFEQSKKAKRPFFLMANSNDPHRPFAGSIQEKRKEDKIGPLVGVDRTFDPDNVPLPGFLADLPAVRLEIAEYFASVHRADQTVGALLKALDDSGLAKQTLVMFISDHGMPLPFAKTNCYRHSTRTPWIVRWPGKVATGHQDKDHMISTIDFMPTILEICGQKVPDELPGRSFLPLLMGETQGQRDQVISAINRTAKKDDFPMRGLQNHRFGYIFNAWADGNTKFKNESQTGRSFRAMEKAARRNSKIAERVHFFHYRAKEEFYDYQNDPDALHNLIEDPDQQGQIDQFRQQLLKYMIATQDPLLHEFKQLIGQS